jgi:hypothetical protein
MIQMIREKTFPFLIFTLLLGLLLGAPGGCAYTFSTTQFTGTGDMSSPGSWEQVTANPGWTARHSHSSVVMQDGTIILMGGNDGAGKNDVWRSTDNGATWTLVNANAGWSPRQEHSSVVMPDGTIVLLGGSTASGYVNDVWQSGDQGTTWIRVNASTGWTPRDSLAIVVLPDSSIIVSGGTLAGGYSQFNDVWRSTDKGVTWTEMTPHAQWSPRYGHRTVVMPDGSIVLTGGYTFGTGRFMNDVWRSSDKGATWTLVNANTGWKGRILHTCVVMPDGSLVLIGGAEPNNVYLNDTWRSTDNGATWTLVNANAGWEARFTQTTVILPDGSIVLMGGWDGREKDDVWRFIPAGLTPKSHAGSPDHTAPTADTTAPAAAFTPGGDADFSSPWRLLNANPGWTPRAWHSTVVIPDGSIVLMGGMDRSFNRKTDTWRSTDNGTSWTLMSANGGWSARYGQSCVVMPDGSILLMGGYEYSTLKNDIWRSADKGATWSLVNPNAAWSARYEHTSVVMPDGSIVLMGGMDFNTPKNDVWKSTDNGATWTLVNPHAGWSARHSASSVVMADGSIVLMGGYEHSGGNGVKGDTWRSTDNGASWTQADAGAWDGRYDFSTVVMPDNSILLMGGVNYSILRTNDIWRSMDNGTTWTLVNPHAGWPARYGQSSVVTADGSIIVMGGTAYGNDGGDMNDIWRLGPAISMSTNRTGGVFVTKTIRPVSLKQGTDAIITIMVLNLGTTPIHDVEILDSDLPEFPVVEGITHDTVPSVESNGTLILTYSVHAAKPGSFRLHKTKVMYADQNGNYQIAYSDAAKVEVLAPLIPPTPENEADSFIGEIIAWYNGLDQYIESKIGKGSGSV